HPFGSDDPLKFFFQQHYAIGMPFDNGHAVITEKKYYSVRREAKITIPGEPCLNAGQVLPPFSNIGQESGEDAKQGKKSAYIKYKDDVGVVGEFAEKR